MRSVRRSAWLWLEFVILLSIPRPGSCQTVLNDNFANALNISGTSGMVSDGNAGATAEIYEPNHLGVAGGHSVWYRWKAKSNGMVAFSTATSNFDTVLAVYTGTQIYGLTFVAGNDDISSLKTSWVAFKAKAGTTYSIAVDGHGAATGNINLAWTQGGSDFDADGRSDLLIQNPLSGQVSAATVFGSAFQRYQSPQTMPDGSQAVGAGDFNGDGMPDAALFNPFTRQVTIGFYAGQVLSSFQPLVTLPAGWRVAGIADFNGDGQPDLLLENPSTRDVAIGYVTSMTLTKYQFVKTLPVGWQVVGVGDFSGDGQPDLVLQNPSTRQISIAYVVGSVLQSYHALVTLPSGWQAVGVGDFNTDGLPDLVLQNPSTRDVAFALVDAQAHVRYSAFVRLPVGWQVAGPLAVVPNVALLYEGWEYPLGSSVTGLNGGAGNWGSPWHEWGQASWTDSVMQSGSLTFGKLRTTGNSLLTTSSFPVGDARRFPVPNTFGTSGTTLYISFLVKPIDPLNAGSPYSYYSLVFGTFNIGKGGRNNFYGMENDSEGGPYYSTGKLAVTGQTAFLVARFTFLAGADICEMWVNPTPGQPLPAAPDAIKADTDTGIPFDFNTGSSIRTVFDEIRFGNSWEAVSPVN